MAFKKESIVKSTIALIAVSGVMKLLGYAEKIVLAYYYGTGSEVDVYLLVSGVVFSLFVLFRELVEPGFLTVFLKIREKDDAEAWRFFNRYARMLFLPVFAVFLSGIIFPGQVIHIFAPGFTPEKKELAVKLLQVSFPAVLFLSMTNLTAITLNSQKRFLLPASGDVVFRAVTLLFLILLYPKYGITGAGIGMVIGAAGKLLVHLLALWRRVSLKRVRAATAYYREVWRLTWPLLLGMLVSQANLLTDNMFASYMKNGTIAALSYAKKIVEMPVVVFPYVLSIVVFPYFSQFAIEKDTARLTKLFYDTMGWIIFLFLPLSVLFFVFPGQLTGILLQRGAFNEASTSLTAQPLAIYSLGMLSFAIETILVLVFFSFSDTKTPVLTGIICVAINILVTIVLIPSVGYLAIAWALVISKTLKILVLGYLLRKKIRLHTEVIIPFVMKVCLATGVFVAYIMCLKYALGTYRPSTAWSGGKGLFLLCAGSGVLIYLLACYLLKMKLLLKSITR